MDSTDRPRAGFRATIYGMYIGAIVCFVAANRYQKEYDHKGYIHIGKGIDGFIDVAGTSAQNNIKAFWLGAVVFSALAVVLTLKYVYLVKTHSLPADPPEPEAPTFVMCTTCLESFWGKDVHEMKCPLCSGTLEDSHGFYQRHPELLSRQADRNEER